MPEREQIFRALAAGELIRYVASRLKRTVFTISCELQRNWWQGLYLAVKAYEAAWE